MSLVGSLQDLHLEDILQIVSLSRKTGVLSIKWSSDSQARVIFREGDIVAAYCSTLEENLPLRLVEDDALSPDESREANKLLTEREGKDALSLICEKFALDRPAVTDAIKAQIERCMARLFSLNEGTFNFDLQPLEESLEELPAVARPFFHPGGLSPQSLALGGLSNVTYEETDHEAITKTPPPTESEELPPEKSLYEQVEMIDLREELRLELGDSDFTEDIGHDLSGSSSRGLLVLKGMIKELMDPQSSRQFLLLILRFASELMSRGIVFKVVEEELRGFGNFGVSIDRQEAEKLVRRIQVPINSMNTFRGVYETMDVFKGPMPDEDWQICFAEVMGPVAPRDVFICPIVIRGKVAFIFFGDDQAHEDRVGETDSFEIFISQAGLAMEKVSLEDELHQP